MKISCHASDRIRERCGLPKRAVERNALLALQKGLTHKESTGSLKRYFDWLYLSYGCASNIRLYGNHAYLFRRDALITVVPLPNAHKAAIQKALKRRSRLGGQNKEE